jgi:dUTP pyrophosphatase
MDLNYIGQLRKGTEQAVGYDLFVSRIEHISPGYVIAYIDLAIEYPEGYACLLLPRSSISKTGWVLANSVGLVDPDYRGQIQAHFRAFPIALASIEGVQELVFPPFPYQPGERCLQMMFAQVPSINAKPVTELSPSKRGDGGFGSTGK